MRGVSGHVGEVSLCVCVFVCVSRFGGLAENLVGGNWVVSI